MWIIRNAETGENFGPFAKRPYASAWAADAGDITGRIFGWELEELLEPYDADGQNVLRQAT